MTAASILSLFGHLQRPFPVPAKTASAVARSRGQGRPSGRRAERARLDDGEHGRTLFSAGISAMTPRAWRAPAAAFFLLMAASPAVAQPAQRQPSTSPTNSISAAIEEASDRFGLPISWIEAVISAESGGDPRAISSKGAMGLMQLMPITWRELRAELGLGADPWDRRDNIIAGAAYLRQLYDRFGRGGFLAAYNAGPARYQAMLDGGRKLPAETLAYVAVVEARIERSAGGARRQISSKRLDWRTAEIFVPSRKAPSKGVEPGVMITVIDPSDEAVRP